MASVNTKLFPAAQMYKGRRGVFTFTGTGAVLTIADFFPANVVVFNVKVTVLTTIAGDSTTNLDVGLAADDDALTPTQITTVTAGVRSGLYFKIDNALVMTGIAAADLTVSTFAVDGTTPKTPTSGKVAIDVVYIDVA